MGSNLAGDSDSILSHSRDITANCLFFSMPKLSIGELGGLIVLLYGMWHASIYFFWDNITSYRFLNSREKRGCVGRWSFWYHAVCIWITFSSISLSRVAPHPALYHWSLNQWSADCSRSWRRPIEGRRFFPCNTRLCKYPLKSPPLLLFSPVHRTFGRSRDNLGYINDKLSDLRWANWVL